MHFVSELFKFVDLLGEGGETESDHSLAVLWSRYHRKLAGSVAESKKRLPALRYPPLRPHERPGPSPLRLDPSSPSLLPLLPANRQFVSMIMS